MSAMLNRYFGRMVECIFSTGGIVDAFIGDAVVAEWGAPRDMEDHAAQACRAALCMRRSLEKLNAQWRAEGAPELSMRVGVNTGEMVVGNLGSPQIFDYSALGNEVNAGARLEPLNKLFGTQCIVSGASRAAAEERAPGEFAFRRLGRVLLKGRQTPLDVYELLDATDEADQRMLDVTARYEQALTQFESGAVSQAAAMLESNQARVSNDGPSRLLLGLCREQVARPDPGFAGVIVQTEK